MKRNIWFLVIIILIIAVIIKSVSYGGLAVCTGSAGCFEGIVSHIADGDTLTVNDVIIRLSLVDAPEMNQTGFIEAKQFTESLCPINSTAVVDEDDNQLEGSYGRTVAVVYCSNKNLNEQLLINNKAILLTYFCEISEFKDEKWTGC